MPPCDPIKAVLTALPIAMSASAAHATVLNDQPAGLVARAGGLLSSDGDATFTGSAAGSIVNLRGNTTTISGDLYYQAAVAVSPGVSVSGSTTQTSSGSAPWNTVNNPGTYTWGGSNVSLSHGESINLAAGTYQDFSTQTDGRVTLSAGEYQFRSVSWSHRTIITADTSGGDIVLYVGTDLDTATDVTLDNTGSGTVYLVVNDDISFSHRNNIEAAVYGFGSSVDFSGNDSQFTGTIYAAGDISLGHRTRLTYQFNQPIPGAPTLAGITIAAGFAAIRRNRRTERNRAEQR